MFKLASIGAEAFVLYNYSVCCYGMHKAIWREEEFTSRVELDCEHTEMGDIRCPGDG